MNTCTECKAKDSLVVQTIVTVHWPVTVRGFPEGEVVEVGSLAKPVGEAQAVLLCTQCGYAVSLESLGKGKYRVLERPAVAAVDEEVEDTSY